MTFYLSIDKFYSQSDLRCKQRTTLSIDRYGYGLIINYKDTEDVIDYINNSIKYYKNNEVNFDLQELLHNSLVFKEDELIFKKHYNDKWNIMNGKDYKCFYNWLMSCLSKTEGRKIKINKILNDKKL